MVLFTTAIDSLRCEISQYMVLIKCGLKNFAVEIKYLKYINTILGLAVYIVPGQALQVPEV
jgi:hypothetical protein